MGDEVEFVSKGTLLPIDGAKAKVTGVVGPDGHGGTMVTGNGDKADASKVSEIKSKIADLKEAVKTNDVDKIKAASEALTKPLYDLTSDMYKQADAQQQAAQQQAGAQQSAGAQQQENQNGEKVVDADYKVVDDDQK